MNRVVNGISEMDAEKLITPEQCRGGRSMIGLTQRELADAVGVSDRTIYGFEKGSEINRPTKMAIRHLLQGRGCLFVEGPGVRVGVTVEPRR